MRVPVLEFQNVTVNRGPVRILDQFSWSVAAGEHWAIIGANGSGKTSLLAVLTGYLTPSAGIIRLLGQEYGQSDWRQLRRRVGLVSSSIRQMMSDSEPVLETIVSGRSGMIDLWGRPSAAERRSALQILKDIGCESLADRPWAVLSQGERQKVLIGRALMARPELLILDEPCAGLDPVAREHFLGFIQRLGEQDGAPSVILVTHHVEEIVPVFGKVLALRRGAVLRSGPAESVITSAVLSEVFDGPVRIARRRGRHWLQVGETDSIF